ncbi:MAG: maleylpyruvate isomerase N-terminal domain-containing protein [Pseudonocardiaceae bacterium]
MTLLSHDRYCAEIVAQTDLLRSCIEGADLTAPVPSCPGWNVGRLLRHLGGAQRWAEATVRTRATQPLPDEHFRDLSTYPDEDPAVLGPWLAEGAAQLADTLRGAGPEAPLWTPVPGGTTRFYARRFTHETAPEAAAEWLIDLTGDAIVWRRAHEKAAVAVRGPLTDLLLVVYKRRPARNEGIEVLGDVQLLGHR